MKFFDEKTGMYYSDSSDGNGSGWYFPTPYEDLEGPYESLEETIIAQSEWRHFMLKES